MTGKPILTPEIHLLRRSYYNPAFFAEAQPKAERESETTPCHTTPCPLGIGGSSQSCQSCSLARMGLPSLRSSSAAAPSGEKAVWRGL